MNKIKKCLIIDGNNLVHRSYHASKKLTWMGENKEIYIFLKIFISLLRKENYEKIFIVFDEGKETFRHSINKDYKANREKSSDELIKHLNEVQDLINKSGLFFTSDKNFEADDLIASFIKKFEKEDGFEFHIFSQDKDLFQLLSENIFILRYNKAILEKFGTENFLKNNNFSHKSFKYYLALIGDKSDNIKGIAGIGEKRAKYIIENFQNAENTFLNINSLPKEIKIAIEGKEKEIEENLKMVSLEEKIELKEWETYNFSWENFKNDCYLINFCKERELNSILFTLIGTQNRTRTDTEKSIGS